MQGGVETIQPYVDEFLEFAKEHPEFLFWFKRIGWNYIVASVIICVIIP